jgi:hypothetical protein
MENALRAAREQRLSVTRKFETCDYVPRFLPHEKKFSEERRLIKVEPLPSDSN